MRAEVRANMLPFPVSPTPVGSHADCFKSHVELLIRSLARIGLKIEGRRTEYSISTLMTAGIPEQVSVPRFFCLCQEAEEPLFPKFSPLHGGRKHSQILMMIRTLPAFLFCVNLRCVPISVYCVSVKILR